MNLVIRQFNLVIFYQNDDIEKWKIERTEVIGSL